MPTLQPKFLREYFFLHPKRIFANASFFKNLFSQRNGLTANLAGYRYECKSLRGQFSADFGGQDFGRTRTASANS